MKADLINTLKEFITEKRFNLFEEVLEKRTKYISVVIEDIYQPHNASAVLRSCDCFGIQDVHVIEKINNFTPNPEIALGASKWLSISQYKGENSEINAINKLREKGYRIVATTPHTNDIDLPKFDLSKGPTALFFGSEAEGLTQDVLDNADEFLKIPMYGFTESFNISVSVAIVLNHLREKLMESNINWQITNDEKEDLMIEWIKKTVKKPELIMARIEQLQKEQ